MKYPISIFVLALLVVGCLPSPTAVPTPAPPTAVPTPIPQPTQEPTNTPLPPTPTVAPTITLPPPSNTPIPLTPTSTATRTRLPATVQPTATATATATEIVLKYSAPTLVEPTTGQTHTTSSDIVFKWQPVAALGTNECYLVTVRITNVTTGEYSENQFIAQDTCNNAGDAPVTFVLHKRPPAPDFFGAIEIANSKGPSSTYHVTWNVLVVQNNGADPNKPDPAQYIPLSPVSGTLDFDLLS